MADRRTRRTAAANLSPPLLPPLLPPLPPPIIPDRETESERKSLGQRERERKGGTLA